jgi:hypothetical protein
MSAFFLLFSVFMLVVAYTTIIPTGISHRATISPMAFPKVVLLVLFAFSTASFVRSSFVFQKKLTYLKNEKVHFFDGKIPVMFVALLAYIVLWFTIGFTFSTFIVFGFVVKYLDSAVRWRNVILITLAFTIGIFILFVLVFKIPFYDPPINHLLYLIRLRSA